MEEVEIIKNSGNLKQITKKLLFIFLTITIILTMLNLINAFIVIPNYLMKSTGAYLEYVEAENIYKEYKEYNGLLNVINKYENSSNYSNEQQNELEKLEKEYLEAKERYEKEKAFDEFFEPFYNTKELVIYLFSIMLILTILTIIFYFYVSKMEIIVTSKRVYGKSAFGKRVDLPIDLISAVGTSFLKGIDVGTSSGKIKFKGIKNNTDIHAEISKLLNNRTSNKQEPVKEKSSAEEIAKYKQLLDNGAITQEEYEMKKKELLKL